jgi:hypothetical protein
VFTCDNGQTRFEQYLQKYSDPVKQQFEATHTAIPMLPGLIKGPGNGKWISETDPTAGDIMMPKCPNGSDHGPIRRVLP